MWFLSVRQLIARPRQTILTFIAIMLGSAAYVAFSGLMLGFQEKILDRLINNDAHIKISPKDDIISPETFGGIFFKNSHVFWLTAPSGKSNNVSITGVRAWYDKLDADPDVEAYAPQISRQVIFTKGKFSIPGTLVGIVPSRQSKISNIQNDITEGSLTDLGKGTSLVIVGEDLMKKLGSHIHDTINVVSPSGSISSVKIIGTIRPASRIIASSIAYSSLSTVQSITHASGEVSVIAVRLWDVSKARNIAEDWSYTSKDKVESWDQANEAVLSIFTTQNIVRNTTTFTIILVISFGIYNILNMVVTQKRREIAILRATGFSNSDILILFLLQGVLLGVAGALTGLLVGAFACWNLQQITIPGAPTGTDHLLVSWNYTIYLKAFLITSLSSALASVIPAYSASKLSPIEVIRDAS